jgi:hypothetical protein
MKDKIERSLAPLVGLPMWAVGRAGDVAVFTFGERRRVKKRHGKVVEVGEYALHVRCAWRLVGAKGIIVASRDYFYPAGNVDDESPDFDHDQPGANRRDERMDVFFAECGDEVPVIQRIEADRLGSLRIAMSGEVTLEVFPIDSLQMEHWRFFRSASGEKPFIVTGLGADWE